MRIGLKVDVNTLHGTLVGVPNLLRLFDRYRVQATFFFSLGLDHSGRALRRLLHPGGWHQQSRLVFKHYGLPTMLYGTLLPAPDIGRRGANMMRVVAAAGHEVAIQGYNHTQWQTLSVAADREWTHQELLRASESFVRIFGKPPRAHGAAGWHINPHLLLLEMELNLDYASDSRGTGPFLPVMRGIPSRCVQIPTTLPTLDELIGHHGIDTGNVHQPLFAKSRTISMLGHVFRLSAELEGLDLLPVLERLLIMWQGDADEIGTLREIFYQQLDQRRLPVHRISMGKIAGRAEPVALQGEIIRIQRPSSDPDELVHLNT